MRTGFKIFTASSLIILFLGCNNAAKQADTAKQDTLSSVTIKEDTTITKLRPVLFDLENQELSFNGRKPFDLTISDIRYTVISYKDYYTEQEAALQLQAKHSVNKEKTDKALSYLDQMIKSASANAAIYKVQFHLKAQVDKNFYNEEKTLYLKIDLTLLKLVFPD